MVVIFVIVTIFKRKHSVLQAESGSEIIQESQFLKSISKLDIAIMAILLQLQLHYNVIISI